jgi:hypothetical protein
MRACNVGRPEVLENDCWDINGDLVRDYRDIRRETAGDHRELNRDPGRYEWMTDFLVRTFRNGLEGWKNKQAGHFGIMRVFLYLVERIK